MFVIVGRHPRFRLAMACVCNVGRSVNQCVNQREKGWSALLVEITSFMGAALESLVDKGVVRVPITIRWQQQTALKTLFLYSLYAFKNLKSSSTWFNPCFPLRRACLLLSCWVSFPTSFYLHKQTLVSTLVQEFLYKWCVWLIIFFAFTISMR